MLTLGPLSLGAIPKIVVGFSDTDSDTLLKEANQNGLDIAELRIDQYASFTAEHALREAKRVGHYFPTIATIRLKREGGRWNLPEAKRWALLKKIIPTVSAVDIELSAESILPDVVERAHAARKLVLMSHHNFDQTPALTELNKIAEKAKSSGADIVKVATFARDQKDILTLAEFTLANREKNLVTIAMGSVGLLSRIFFPALGSMLTYAYLGKPMAPGQIDYFETFHLLRRFYPEFHQEKVER